MNYRTDKYGNRLSILGFGCLRLQKNGGRIDMEQANEQLMAAFRGGVNYYDTAYIYAGSEAAIGEVFEKNGIRDQVYIATKLPHYLIKSREGMDRLFREELKRLRTDYVDYYLMHMLSDVGTWEKLKKIGVEDWIAEKKASGAIRQIGFSYHGNSENFCKLLDAYDWDFCQIQYNYMDENTQAGRKGLQYAHSKGIPVIIMEPLRGGRLVNNLPQKAKQIFAEYPVKRTPAQWGYRWLWDQEEVTVVLSGMNTVEMVLDNVQTASQVRVGELNAHDKAMLRGVVKAINEGVRVGCTGCGYCMPCPKGVDIPGTFASYNRYCSGEKFNAFREYTMTTAFRRDNTAASNCVGCGKCEKHCPQGIEIRSQLKAASKTLENPAYKVTRQFVKWFKIF